MITDTEEALLEIYRAMVRSAPPRWKMIRLSITGLGASIDYKNVSFAHDNSRTNLDFDVEGMEAGARLREGMFRPGKGTWYTALLTVESDGKCDVRYEYDSAPLDPDFGEALDDIREEAIEDQELFPRAQAHLPEWHPSRK
jgi:hypothetical protein